MKEREDMQVDGVCCEDFWQYVIGDFLDPLIDNVIDNIVTIALTGLFLYRKVQNIFTN